MYWAAFKVVGTREGLDDIVGDACIALICKVSRLRALDCNIRKGYVISTTKNAALKYVQKRKRQGGVADGEDILRSIASEDPQAIDQMVYEETVQRLMCCLEKLSERDQGILKMKYIHEMSDQAMAEVLQVKSATVRACLTRARQRAYKLMKEMLDDED